MAYAGFYLSNSHEEVHSFMSIRDQSFDLKQSMTSREPVLIGRDTCLLCGFNMRPPLLFANGIFSY